RYIIPVRAFRSPPLKEAGAVIPPTERPSRRSHNATSTTQTYAIRLRRNHQPLIDWLDIGGPITGRSRFTDQSRRCPYSRGKPRCWLQKSLLDVVVLNTRNIGISLVNNVSGNHSSSGRVWRPRQTRMSNRTESTPAASDATARRIGPNGFSAPKAAVTLANM